MIHKLKIEADFFKAIKSGSKLFELRRNDRDYQEGDLIQFRVVENGRVTIEDDQLYEINYILKGWGLKDGFVALGIKPCMDAAARAPREGEEDDKKSSPFSNGTEYEFFKECWCEKCKHYKVRDDGFPEFPENGGCRILDCMEYARFDEKLWPNKKIVEEWEYGKVKRWHKCLDFERREIADEV